MIISAGASRGFGALVFQIICQHARPCDHVLLVCTKQLVERLAQLSPRDLLAVDIQLGEEKLVQERPDMLVASGVGDLGRFEQGKRIIENLSAELQVLVGALQRTADVSRFLPDRLQPFPKLGLWPLFVGGKVKEVALLAVERGKPLFVLLAQFFGQLAFSSNGIVHRGTYSFQPFRPDRQRIAVVADDGFLEDVERDVGHVAEPLLPAATQPVEVLTAVADRPLHDEPMLAPGTPQRALEIVVMRPLTGT